MQAIFCYWDAISRNIVIAHSLKSLKDVPMRRPDTHFVRVLSRLMSKNILKALITELYTIKVDICHPGAISLDKSYRPCCKKPIIGGPGTRFAPKISLLASTANFHNFLR